MNAHTPGPWKVVTGNKNRNFDQAAIRHDHPSDKYPVTLARVSSPAHEIGIANARLIAAAPDLLAFVEEFIDAWENGMAGDSYLLRLANSVKAKALGSAQ